MLPITIPAGRELFDERTQTFITLDKPVRLSLEHSLVSLSKWESHYCKPFLTNKEKTFDETLYYIKCMTLTQNVDPNIYLMLNKKEINIIMEYISKPQTASTVPHKNQSGPNREQPTSELIYYWMITLGVPVEFQKWHLSRLLMLIDICNFKNRPPKKMSKSEIAQHHRAVNAANRKRYSKGR